jgi:Sec-independent protein translocase protein TatA
VFGISMWELGLILLVALIFLGPKQLMETARVLGSIYRELQKMVWDVRKSVDLDSVLSSDNNWNETPKPPPVAPRNTYRDKDLIPPPGEKSGPDFYAELLEKANEPDEISPETKESVETDTIPSSPEKSEPEVKPEAKIKA